MPAHRKWLAARFAPLALTRAALPSAADEGYWLFSAPPLQAIEARYGIALSGDRLRHLEYATARVGVDGTSGAFVSAHGLFLTARHVIPAPVRATVQPLLDAGFAANTPDTEIPLKGMSVYLLLEERDITGILDEAARHGDTAHRDDRVRAALQHLERAYSHTPNAAVQSVALFGGAKHMLYVYRRYNDVRIVFAPESALAASDTPYPGPALDIALLRVYDRGKPAVTPHFLKIATGMPREGDPIFVSGAPYAGSWRYVPVAELDAMRRVDLPVAQQAMSKTYSRLAAALDGLASPSTVDVAALQRDRFFRELLELEQREFADPAFLGKRRAEELALRESFALTHDAEGLQALDDIAVAETALAPLRSTRALIPWTGSGEPIMWQAPDADVPWGAYLAGTTWIAAEVLLRDREERRLSDNQRSSGFRESDRHALERWLFGGPCEGNCAPTVDPAIELAQMTAFLESLAEVLPAQDPIVTRLLDGKTPRERASELVHGTQLTDPAFRRHAYNSNEAGFDEIHDPLLDTVRAVYPELRQRGIAFDSQFARLKSAAERWAAAAFRARGDAIYPETSGTLRLGYGAIRSYEPPPRELTMDPAPRYRLPAIANIGDLLAETHREHAPLELPPRWQTTIQALPVDTPTDFLSTVDGVAGNSGSVTVNAQGEVVGVLFGGVAGGAASQYVYEGALREPDRNTHSAAGLLIPMLRVIYRADRIADELNGAEVNP